MRPERLEIVRGWIAKSKSDLETAQLLIVGENRHLDTGAYHCPESVAAPQTRAMTAFLLLSPVPACPNHRSPVISFP